MEKTKCKVEATLGVIDGIEVHSEEDRLYGWGGQRSQSGLQGNDQTVCVNKYLRQVLT